jgi:hypothetical protein
MIFYTYAHYTPEGRLFYIGKGQRRRAWNCKNRNPYWNAVIAKHGKPKIEILARWKTEKEALDHEVFLISCFGQMRSQLVNLTVGGDGVSGLKHSAPTREILRQKSLANGSVERVKAMSIDPVYIEKRKKATTGKKRTEMSKERMAQAKQYKARSFVIAGVKFNSIASFAKVTGYYRTTVRRWLDADCWDKLEGAYRATLS